MEKIKNFILNFIKADRDVQIRTIALLIAIINLILYLIGKDNLPVTAEQVWGGVSIVLTVITSIPAWWKNNSISPEAKQADKFLDQLRGVINATENLKEEN